MNEHVNLNIDSIDKEILLTEEKILDIKEKIEKGKKITSKYLNLEGNTKPERKNQSKTSSPIKKFIPINHNSKYSIKSRNLNDSQSLNISPIKNKLSIKFDNQKIKLSIFSICEELLYENKRLNNYSNMTFNMISLKEKKILYYYDSINTLNFKYQQINN